MRVVFLTEFYPSSVDADVKGGAELHIFSLSQYLGKRHDVTIIARHEEECPATQQVGTVHVHRVGPKTRYSQRGGFFARLAYLLPARQATLDLEPTAIIGGTFLGYFLCLFLPLRLRVKTALVYHDVWIGEWVKHVGLLNGMFGEIVERLVARTHWAAIFPNSKVVDRKLKQHHFRAKRMEIVSCGADIAEIERIPAYHFDKPTVLVVARLVRYKKIDDVIQAFAQVDRRHTAQLLIIGTGPERQPLEQLVAQLGLGAHVHFIGSLAKHNDVLSYIKGADIFCLPSSVEGFGIVTLEAMACGTPYISSDIPPTREVTDGGRGGILYPVGDSASLAAHLNEYLHNRKRENFSGAGKKQALLFDTQRIGRQFEEYLLAAVE